MAKIVRISVEGFVSIIGKIKYKFDRPGLSLITGKNGAGKTTLFNALAYGLYGKTLKPESTVLPWPFIIDSNYRGCCIKVVLDDEYVIYRCNDFKGKVLGRKGGNRLVIIHNGAELARLRNKSDAQDWINQTIGYTWPLFRSAVLFPQELSSLIEEDGPTKKKIFDEAFSSTFINFAKVNAETKLKQLYHECESLQSSIDAENKLLENNISLCEQMDEVNSKFRKEKKTLIFQLGRNVEALKKKKTILKQKYNPNTKKPELLELRKNLIDQKSKIAHKLNPHLADEEFRLMLDITRYTEELEETQQAMKQIKASIMGKITCPTCAGPLSPKKVKEIRSDKKRQYAKLVKAEKEEKKLVETTTIRHGVIQNQLKEDESTRMELREIEKQLGVVEEELNQIKKVIRKINELKLKIRLKNREIIRIKKTKTQHDTTPLKEKIETSKAQITVWEDVLMEYKKKVEIQEWLIKDPLSNSGLKAFIFDSMLRRTNFHLRKYTQYVGFRVEVGIDLESRNKDFRLSIFRGENEVPYADLSKGQKQLAKVILCFAVNKTMQGSKPINILLLDELFESLADENVEIVGNIILSEARTKSVHLITHHSAFNPTSCYRVFVGLNDKGQTVIEQKYRDA
jgi:DNA repair exonuclease SbcCD ATPase subunit